MFFLTEKLMSASGDDFDIKDANNPANHFQLKSSTFSMKGARVLKDGGGNTIINMKHKVRCSKACLSLRHIQQLVFSAGLLQNWQLPG